MPLPSSINDLSTTASANSPAGSESPGNIDDYLRTHASYIADLRDRPGRLIGIQVLTASGTYTPTSGTKSVVVHLVGGGGAGGGYSATAAGQISVGGGGGAGGYVRSRLTTGFSGASLTIGAGGTPAAGAVGGGGGASTFAGTLSASGGSGGGVSPAVSGSVVTGGGFGGNASGGNLLNIKGASGAYATGMNTTYWASGAGASTPFGSGGEPRYSTTSSGAAAVGYGSGGGGAAGGPAQGIQAGGNGANGVAIIEEYA